MAAPGDVVCPLGHSNPSGWEFCGTCGTPLETVSRGWFAGWRRPGRQAALTAGLMVAATVASIVALNGSEVANSPSAASVPVDKGSFAQWWSSAEHYFTELRDDIDVAQDAGRTQDASALEEACQSMHDVSAVRLQALMPTPTRALTAELEAATQDAHGAAHMCLAAAAGSRNSYLGEFQASIDQAERHLRAAQRIINETLAFT